MEGASGKSDGGLIVRASYVSVIGNGLLSAAKIVAGIISGSFAVVSDGIDSASDVAMSRYPAPCSSAGMSKNNPPYNPQTYR